MPDVAAPGLSVQERIAELARRLLDGELKIRDLDKNDPRYQPSVDKWQEMLAEYEQLHTRPPASRGV